MSIYMVFSELDEMMHVKNSTQSVTYSELLINISYYLLFSLGVIFGMRWIEWLWVGMGVGKHISGRVTKTFICERPSRIWVRFNRLHLSDEYCGKGWG